MRHDAVAFHLLAIVPVSVMIANNSNCCTILVLSATSGCCCAPGLGGALQQQPQGGTPVTVRLPNGAAATGYFTGASQSASLCALALARCDSRWSLEYAAW